MQGRARPSLAQLYNWRYKELKDLPHVHTLPQFVQANAGFAHEFQFIDVPQFRGTGESEPTPHFYQNVDEAEFLVRSLPCAARCGFCADGDHFQALGPSAVNLWSPALRAPLRVNSLRPVSDINCAEHLFSLTGIMVLGTPAVLTPGGCVCRCGRTCICACSGTPRRAYPS